MWSALLAKQSAEGFLMTLLNSQNTICINSSIVRNEFSRNN